MLRVYTAFPLSTIRGELHDAIRPGDLILSRSEHDPDGVVEPKVVEEVFRRFAPIWHLHVCGQVIRTTGEHPFFARGKGWVPCAALAAGDRLLGHDGQWLPVEDLLDTGEREPVFNMRVADYHTYFVGCGEWGFTAWAHNEYTRDKQKYSDRLVERFGDKDGRALADLGDKEGINGDYFVDHMIRSAKDKSSVERARIAADMLGKSHTDVARQFPIVGGPNGSGRMPEVLGGKHRETAPGGLKAGMESHHMLADEVSPINREDAPAIRMETLDHEKRSGTWGNSESSKFHRDIMAGFVRQGNLTAAFEYGIWLVESATGSKYAEAIAQMRAAMPKNSDGTINSVVSAKL